ncbi:MAG: hypothetical protein WA277_05855 [Nitrospirota bacterium]
MKTIDLNDNLKPLYFVCLEDWSEEVKKAGNHKEVWYNKVKDKASGLNSHWPPPAYEKIKKAIAKRVKKL